MYERFTDRARKVMQLANQEAIRYQHEYIGTEHVLLGLTIGGAGVGATVLKNLDIKADAIRRQIEMIIQPGPWEVKSSRLPPTPRAKKVIEYSIEEAHKLGHDHVGTEHLLLGLLREQEGVASQVLMNLGLKLQDVRDEVLNMLGPEGDQPRVPVVDQPCLVDKGKPENLPPRIAQAVESLDQLCAYLQQMKEDAISRRDFEWAASLRDQQEMLKTMRKLLIQERHREPTDPPF